MSVSLLAQRVTLLYIGAFVASFLVTWVSADIMVYSTKTHRQIEIEFRDIPSRFGGSIPPTGLRAFVVYAKPSNGCVSIENPPNVTENFTGHWAVLIARYNCSFEEKVRNAQSANFDIAIIHNVNSNELEPMSAKDPRGIHIPSVFVGENTGLMLKDNYQYTNGYYVIIDDDSPFDVNTHLLLPFVIVVGICFLTMLGFLVSVVFKCIKDHRRARRHRLSSSSLRKIPTAKFRKGDPYETCAICLEDYIEGEKLRILPCSHAYHCKCIDPWLTRNKRVCPVCKRKVFAADEVARGGMSDTDSDSDADDTTPLMRQISRRVTQGGTFTNFAENPLQRPAEPVARRHSVSSLSSLSNDGHGTGGGIQPPGPSHSHGHLAPRIGSIQDNYDSSSAGGVSDTSVYTSAISSSRQPLIESNTSLENTQLDGCDACQDDADLEGRARSLSRTALIGSREEVSSTDKHDLVV